jgi:hypothetical protein
VRHTFVFIYLVIIIVFGWNPEGKATNIPGKQINPTEQGISNICFYTSANSDFHNIAINEVTFINPLTGSRESFQKFPFSAAFTEKKIEKCLKDKISDYLFITECRTIRLEGPDIIHPFDYFW